MSDEPITIPPPSGTKQRAGCGCTTVGMVVAVVIFLGLTVPTSGRSEWMFEFVYHLGTGWLLHFSRCVARLGPEMPRFVSSAVLPALAASGALIGFHRLIGWWLRERGTPVVWRVSHSAMAGLLVLLGCAAAISLSGVLHELAWLPQGKVIRSNMRTTRTMALNNARQLLLAIYEFETANGRLPVSVNELQASAIDLGLPGRVVHVELDAPAPSEPFVLLKTGRISDLDPDDVLLMGPLLPDGEGFVVLKADSSVITLPAGRFAEVLKSGKVPDPFGK